MSSKEFPSRRQFLQASAILMLAGGCRKAIKIVSGEGDPISADPSRGTNDSSQSHTSPENTQDIVPSDEPATKEASPKPTEIPKTYTEKYIYPTLLEVANQRREKVSKEDSDFYHRVDKEMNEGRVNVALLGIGSEKVLTDSIQIISIDTKKSEMKAISIPRDTEAPEISRFTGIKKGYRINQAHILGGMPLVERILEDATGLSADFVVVMKMEVLSSAIEEIFNDKLEVCLPWEIKDPIGYWPQGNQILSGKDVLSISRARYYATNEARNKIQQYVMWAILKNTKSQMSAGLGDAAKLAGRYLDFYLTNTKNGNISTNFDNGIFIDLGFSFVKQVIGGGEDFEAAGFGLPKYSQSYHVRVENAGVSYDTGRQKPIDGDRNARDLVADFWKSSRSDVKRFLSSEIQGIQVMDVSSCSVND